MTAIDIAGADAPEAVSRPDYRYVTAGWPGAHYRVDRRPALHVRVEHGADYEVMVEVETGVHGVGRDLHGAWDDLRRALIEHIDVLRRQDALSPELAHQLAYLTERVTS